MRHCFALPPLCFLYEQSESLESSERYSYSSQFIAQICLCFTNPPIETERHLSLECSVRGGPAISPAILNTSSQSAMHSENEPVNLRPTHSLHSALHPRLGPSNRRQHAPLELCNRSVMDAQTQKYNPRLKKKQISQITAVREVLIKQLKATLLPTKETTGCNTTPQQQQPSPRSTNYLKKA